MCLQHRHGEGGFEETVAETDPGTGAVRSTYNNAERGNTTVDPSLVKKKKHTSYMS